MNGAHGEKMNVNEWKSDYLLTFHRNTQPCKIHDIIINSPTYRPVCKKISDGHGNEKFIYEVESRWEIKSPFYSIRSAIIKLINENNRISLMNDRDTGHIEVIVTGVSVVAVDTIFSGIRERVALIQQSINEFNTQELPNLIEQYNKINDSINALNK